MCFTISPDTKCTLISIASSFMMSFTLSASSTFFSGVDDRSRIFFISSAVGSLLIFCFFAIMCREFCGAKLQPFNQPNKLKMSTLHYYLNHCIKILFKINLHMSKNCCNFAENFTKTLEPYGKSGISKS